MFLLGNIIKNFRLLSKYSWVDDAAEGIMDDVFLK